ncbi:MAG: hypothetical protein JJT85_08660 [Chromatiales bacterium]|nr:hypothetical protein [Chromatiales bacterium]
MSLAVFIVLALIAALAAVLILVRPLMRDGRAALGPGVAIAVLLPVAVLASYLVVTNHDWSRVGDEQALAPPPGSMEEAMRALEVRLQADPEDLDTWLVLGSAHVSLGQFAEGALAYERALALSGGQDVMAMLGLAEAMALMDRSALAADAGRLVEAALDREPENARALWYGGLAAIARSEFTVAVSRWESLMALSPPEEIRGVLERELATLRQVARSGAAPVPPAGPARFSVRVSVDEGLRDRVRAGAPMFLVVRDAASLEGGLPLAAVRLDAGRLPADIPVSDQDVMLPGLSLVNLERAQIIARVANGGDASAQAGDIFGVATWEAGSGDAVNLVIDQVYEP